MDAALVQKGGGGSDGQNYAVIIKIIMKHTYNMLVFFPPCPENHNKLLFRKLRRQRSRGCELARVQSYIMYYIIYIYSPPTRVPVLA